MSDETPPGGDVGAPGSAEARGSKDAFWGSSSERRIVASATFSYLTIVALQLKVMWSFWSGRDLTSGDTSSYAVNALSWAHSLKGPIGWSPLYTAFYGAVVRTTNDIVTATLVHRLILVMVIAVMVLALARQLLPPQVAWLVAAWWVVLPINFDSLYEVHLFATVLPLAAALLLARRSDRGARAAALSLFLVTAVLVRNEMIVAFALFLGLCAWSEWRQLKESGPELTWRQIGRPYEVALFAATVMIAVFFFRSNIPPQGLIAHFQAKEELNFCQAFTFGYQQRHPEWRLSPFGECQKLVSAEFSTPKPTFLTALRRNPRALAEHFAWNLKLTPYGLQLALFNESAGTVNPDYVQVSLGKRRPLVLTILAAMLGLAGLWSLLRERGRWWDWLRSRAWALAALGCSSVVGFLAIIFQRPRPSYFFLLTLSAMLALGLAMTAVLERLHLLDRLASGIVLIAIVLLIVVPSHYRDGVRPLHDAYYRLKPSSMDISGGANALVPGYAGELCNYLTPERECKFLDYWGNLRPSAVASGSLQSALDESGVRFVYADAGMLADPVYLSVFEYPARSGWEVVAGDRRGMNPWLLLRRDS